MTIKSVIMITKWNLKITQKILMNLIYKKKIKPSGKLAKNVDIIKFNKTKKKMKQTILNQKLVICSQTMALLKKWSEMLQKSNDKMIFKKKASRRTK